MKDQGENELKRVMGIFWAYGSSYFTLFCVINLLVPMIEWPSWGGAIGFGLAAGSAFAYKDWRERTGKELPKHFGS